MLTLDGIEYDIKTPEENVTDLVAYINNYCLEHNIKNSEGEIIQIEANESNPFYMLTFGLSYLTTLLQRLVYNAGCSMSIPESSERQLLNLADIAGIRRRNATKTVIQGTVYSSEDALGPCIITQENTATVYIGELEVIFSPAYDVTIPPGSSRQIMLVADEYGSFNISANTIIEFDEPVEGFRSMTTLASTPGQSQETISSLRSRLQRRSVEGTQTERAAEAIQNLDGVSLCNIYFNKYPNTTIYVGSRAIPVAPRTALLFVQGWSTEEEAIAKVFYRYLLCETSGFTYVYSEDGETFYSDREMTTPATIPEGKEVISLENNEYCYINIEGGEYQIYTTKAGQVLPVCIIPPVLTPVYVRVFIRNKLDYGRINAIKDVISSLSSNLTIGQELTSVDITAKIAEEFTDLEVQGAEIGLGGEITVYVYSNDGETFYTDDTFTTPAEIPEDTIPARVGDTTQYFYKTLQIDWSYKKAPTADAVFIFNNSNLFIEEVLV